jgi:hypothetical protein
LGFVVAADPKPAEVVDAQSSDSLFRVIECHIVARFPESRVSCAFGWLGVGLWALPGDGPRRTAWEANLLLQLRPLIEPEAARRRPGLGLASSKAGVFCFDTASGLGRGGDDPDGQRRWSDAGILNELLQPGAACQWPEGSGHWG